MTLRTDPDDLSQGAVTTPAAVTFTVGSPEDTAVMTSAATMPVILAGEFFEIRGHTTGQNNGLYQEVGGSPTTSSVTARKISGNNPITAGAVTVTWLGNSSASPVTSSQKSVHIATGDRDIYLLEQGLIDPEGVTEQALYSFLK